MRSHVIIHVGCVSREKKFNHIPVWHLSTKSLSPLINLRIGRDNFYQAINYHKVEQEQDHSKIEKKYSCNNVENNRTVLLTIDKFYLSSFI